MIDVGIKIEIATAAGETAPVTGWRELKNCTVMPALLQPSSKIGVDYIGDAYTSEILGKKAITGLDFTFAFDGSKGATTGVNPKPADQFRFLCDIDDNNERHFLRVTYPDGTKFELLVECEVTTPAPAPSAEILYTLSVTPCRTSVFDELIEVVYSDETDPLASS